MQGLSSPIVFVPKVIAQGTRTILDAYKALDGCDYLCTITPCEVTPPLPPPTPPPFLVTTSAPSNLVRRPLGRDPPPSPSSSKMHNLFLLGIQVTSAGWQARKAELWDADIAVLMHTTNGCIMSSKQ